MAIWRAWKRAEDTEGDDPLPVVGEVIVSGPGAREPGRPRGSFRPRSGRPPSDSLDALDRHLLRATESDESLSRYRAIIREVRRVVVVLGLVVLACALLTGVGAAGALLLLGGSVEVAVGAGAGVAGIAAGVLLRWIRRRTQ